MKRNTRFQSMRLEAINAQLKALESQALAIEKICTEHNEGINLGVDPEVNNALSFARKLVSNVATIVENSRNGDVDSAADQLPKIKEIAGYLLERSELFRKHGQVRADAHLKHHMGDEASEPADGAALERAAVSSYAQAGFSCFRAESNQYFSFEWQLNSLVHLALEMSYFAADELGLKPTGR